ncbi:hypothetical protein BV20DRAFT_822414 [Pilatotrama ljubarskyi]|nr:hypothetical protein BV20DRAFT_822414 [Pilatotrama ljubarskyi]
MHRCRCLSSVYRNMFIVRLGARPASYAEVGDDHDDVANDRRPTVYDFKPRRAMFVTCSASAHKRRPRPGSRSPKEREAVYLASIVGPAPDALLDIPYGTISSPPPHRTSTEPCPTPFEARRSVDGGGSRGMLATLSARKAALTCAARGQRGESRCPFRAHSHVVGRFYVERRGHARWSWTNSATSYVRGSE